MQIASDYLWTFAGHVHIHVGGMRHRLAPAAKIAAVGAVGLVAFKFPTVIPEPTLTWVKPCWKCVSCPAMVPFLSYIRQIVFVLRMPVGS